MIMSSKEKCRHELEIVFNRLANDISNAFHENKNYNDELEKQIMELSLSIKNRQTNSGIRDDHPLLAHYAAVRKKMENDFEIWLDNMAQSQKNKLFRNKFNESMLVYVYGKVKSGKSSLGNFIAYGKHDPSSEDIESQTPIEFDVEEISDADVGTRGKLEKQKNQMRQEKKFLVDFFEATACIQYFKKPGFTWVDSPGIHSTTKENGKLAGEYLESSDLVVYAMTGRSSARDSDRKEIREIIKSGKKLLLLVTRCDDIEQDEDENTGEMFSMLKMYSSEELSEVKHQSVNAILEDLGSDATESIKRELENNTFTLSVKYAEEHPDEPGWSESGMASFYQALGDIAKSEGVRIKMNAPIQAALDHIAQMREDTIKLRAELDGMNNQVKNSTSELEHQSQIIALNDGRDLAYKINNLARECQGNDQRFREQIQIVAEEALEQASGKLARLIAQNAVDITSGLRDAKIDFASLPTFQDIYQTITYHVTTNKRRGSLLGALAGGAIGFFVGGPAGAAIGAGIGSTGGSVIGGSMDGSKSQNIKVGDNSLEVGQQAAQKAREWLEESLAQMNGSIQEACLLPLQQWLRETQAELIQFEVFLQTKKQSLEKEITHGA